MALAPAAACSRTTATRARAAAGVAAAVSVLSLLARRPSPLIEAARDGVRAAHGSAAVNCSAWTCVVRGALFDPDEGWLLPPADAGASVEMRALRRAALRRYRATRVRLGRFGRFRHLTRAEWASRARRRATVWREGDTVVGMPALLQIPHFAEALFRHWGAGLAPAASHAPLWVPRAARACRWCAELIEVLSASGRVLSDAEVLGHRGLRRTVGFERAHFAFFPGVFPDAFEQGGWFGSAGVASGGNRSACGPSEAQRRLRAAVVSRAGLSATIAFGSAVASFSRPRVLVVQRQTGGRRLRNLEALTRTLAAVEVAQRADDSAWSALELAAVTFEAAALRAQVRDVARATVLVAAHGAALTNLVWLPPGALVVELAPPLYEAPRYFGALACETAVELSSLRDANHSRVKSAQRDEAAGGGRRCGLRPPRNATEAALAETRAACMGDYLCRQCARRAPVTADPHAVRSVVVQHLRKRGWAVRAREPERGAVAAKDAT